MAVVKGYYDPNQGAPFELAGPAQVDALLDRTVAEAKEAEVGVVAELYTDGEDRKTILQFGVRTDDVGMVGYLGRGETSAISDNGGTSPEPIAYDYQCHEREVPSNAEVSLETVRQAVHEYVASGGARPSGVTWREL